MTQTNLTLEEASRIVQFFLIPQLPFFDLTKPLIFREDCATSESDSATFEEFLLTLKTNIGQNKQLLDQSLELLIPKMEVQKFNTSECAYLIRNLFKYVQFELHPDVKLALTKASDNINSLCSKASIIDKASKVRDLKHKVKAEHKDGSEKQLCAESTYQRELTTFKENNKFKKVVDHVRRFFSTCATHQPELHIFFNTYFQIYTRAQNINPNFTFDAFVFVVKKPMSDLFKPNIDDKNLANGDYIFWLICECFFSAKLQPSRLLEVKAKSEPLLEPLKSKSAPIDKRSKSFFWQKPKQESTQGSDYVVTHNPLTTFAPDSGEILHKVRTLKVSYSEEKAIEEQQHRPPRLIRSESFSNLKNRTKKPHTASLIVGEKPPKP